ncbi:MAG: EamA/RhaT family transporter [Ruminococcaceae bacterium]|nr:EamA/RhaT family transporter [Oscillospiraceae bacterium]
MRSSLKPRLMIALSMCIFGTIAIFVRNIPLSSAQLSLSRAVIAAVLIGLYLLVGGKRIAFRGLGRQLPALLVSGAALGINWILLFEAYKYTTVSVATLSYYFAPVIIILTCPLLFKEKMGVKQWLCFVMSTLGIVLITGLGDISGGSSHIKGIAFGLAAACFYAFVVISNKFIKGVDGIQRTFLQFVAAAIVLAPYVHLTEGFSLAAMDARGFVFLGVVGLIHTGVCYCLYFSALKDVSGQEAAILSYADPLVAVLASVFVLGEAISLPQIIGGVLILGFTLWNELGNAK